MCVCVCARNDAVFYARVVHVPTTIVANVYAKNDDSVGGGFFEIHHEDKNQNNTVNPQKKIISPMFGGTALQSTFSSQD